MMSHVELAKKAIRQFVEKGTRMEIPEGLSDQLLRKRAGVFVTIKKGENLRGCIGTFVPTKKNIAAEIINNAISACSEDPRFYSINTGELEEISVEVSVLGNPRLIADLKKHDPKKKGIIVSTEDGRRGLLLPGLPGIETIEMQVKIAAEKAGIDPLSELVKLHSFSTKVYKQ